MGMNLRDWRKLNNKTLKDVAEDLALAGGGRTIQRIETGEVDADADMRERIARYTHGLVTPIDMHETRLNWLAANRPERMALVDRAEPSTPAEAAE